MRHLIGIGALGLGAMLAGCFLITGSTDGYALLDAGRESGCPAEDGGICVSLECASATDCSPTGAVCCGGLLASNAIGTTCRPGLTCTGTTVQVCLTDVECDQKRCIKQNCELSGSTVTLSACGLAKSCTAVGPGDTSDAGHAGDDAGNEAGDAGIADAAAGDSTITDSGSDG